MTLYCIFMSTLSWYFIFNEPCLNNVHGTNTLSSRCTVCPHFLFMFSKCHSAVTVEILHGYVLFMFYWVLCFSKCLSTVQSLLLLCSCTVFSCLKCVTVVTVFHYGCVLMYCTDVAHIQYHFHCAVCLFL